MTQYHEKEVVAAHQQGLESARLIYPTILRTAATRFTDEDARVAYIAGYIGELRRLAKGVSK
jgi:hypothetical protein